MKWYKNITKKTPGWYGAEFTSNGIERLNTQRVTPTTHQSFGLTYNKNRL